MLLTHPQINVARSRFDLRFQRGHSENNGKRFVNKTEMVNLNVYRRDIAAEWRSHFLRGPLILCGILNFDLEAQGIFLALYNFFMIILCLTLKNRFGALSAPVDAIRLLNGTSDVRRRKS